MSLCTTCRARLLSRLHPSRSQSLRYATTTSAASSPSPSGPPPAISSSSPGLSQPFSTPDFAPASSTKPLQPHKKPPRLVGSLPGGSELRGLGYLKAKTQVLAKEDDEYPSWLWTLLQDNNTAPGEVKVDVSSLTKRQRMKHDRKQEKLRKTMPPLIPVHEQSKDLTGPGDSAFVSLERRQEITKSSRVARRKGIREDNFLRSM